MWRALPLSFLPAWAHPWSVIWWQALLIYDVKIFFSKSFFQVSLAAFSILMDYFSSIPVTKKNLVTRQTELLVSAMAFSVCSQVMFASIHPTYISTHQSVTQATGLPPPPPLPLRGLILWLGFYNPSLGVQLLWFPDWSVCLYFGFSISYCSQCLTFHTLFRVSRSWPVCALNTSQNLSPCSVLASEVIFVTAGKMFGLKVQWCKLFWQISPLFWLFLFWIYHDVWCCYNDQRHENFHYCQGKSILIRPKSDHCLPLLYRNKSWSNFIVRISTKYQLQNLNYTSGSRLLSL